MTSEQRGAYLRHLQAQYGILPQDGAAEDPGQPSGSGAVAQRAIRRMAPRSAAVPRHAAATRPATVHRHAAVSRPAAAPRHAAVPRPAVLPQPAVPRRLVGLPRAAGLPIPRLMAPAAPALPPQTAMAINQNRQPERSMSPFAQSAPRNFPPPRTTWEHWPVI